MSSPSVNPKNNKVFLSDTAVFIKRICQTFTVTVTVTQIFPVPKERLRLPVPWEPRKHVEEAYSSMK